MAGELNFNLLNPNLPANTAGSIFAGQQAGQANELARMQLQESRTKNEMSQYALASAKRTDEQQNSLNQMMQQGFDPSNQEHLRRLYAFGPAGQAMIKSIQEGEVRVQDLRDKQAGTQGKNLDNAEKKAKQSAQARRDIVNRPDNENILSHLRDTLESDLYTPQEKTKAQEFVNRIMALPYEQRAAAIGVPGASASDMKPATSVVDQGGQRSIVQTPAFGGKPVTQGVYADVPLPADVQAQKLAASRAGAASTTVKLPEQEKAFEKELGKGQAEALMKGKAGAEDAVEILNTVAEGRKILSSGVITGFGAEFFVKFDQALKKAGINYGGDASANSQAYSANMAQNVGKIIKQFGAGTGLSDADREYAEKMAGGKITMDVTAIRRILDINERAARNSIKVHNKKAAGIKTNIDLTVQAPSEDPGKGVNSSNPLLQ